VEGLEMVKQQLVDGVFEEYKKYSVSREELDKKYDEFETELSAWFSGADLEERIKRRFIAYFSKIARSPVGVDFQGIALSVQVTDFGASKAKNEALKRYAEDPEKAVAEGYVRLDDNHNPVPIYVHHKVRNGQDIKIEKSKQLVMLVKRNDDQADSVWKIAHMGVGKNKVDLTIPMFKLINFKALVNSKKSDEEEYYLNASNDCNFEIQSDISPVEIQKLLHNVFADSFVPISGLRAWHEANKDDMNRLVFTGGDAVSIYLTEGDKSNVVILNDSLSTDITLACWFAKIPELDIRFNESAQDIIVCGRTGENQTTGDLSLNVFGCFVDEKFMTVKSKEVTPE
jgi:hypothetical protein